MKRCLTLLPWLALLTLGTARAEWPIFDAHLHYHAAHAEAFPPPEVMAIFDRNGITHGLITSNPTRHTERLHAHAPGRIVPFLSVYRSYRDKRDWMHDTRLPAKVESALESGVYRGIGELHIFAKDRESPVFRRIVEIADQRDLMLLIHGDAEIIDEIFAIDPGATVLWAHLGTRPEPAFLRGVLERHPERLFIDTSVRDERFLHQGRLRPEWRRLFTDHADRFLVGVDTFSVNRWRHFDAVVATMRRWLTQLPPPVARRLAFENARELFEVDHGDQ